MQQSSATQSLHLSFWGLRKIVACSHSSSQCLLVSTVFGTVSSLHPTSVLMIFILVNVTTGELEKCADKLHLYSLLPFFKNNEEVLKDYKHRSTPEDHGIKSDIVELQEIVDGKK